MSKKVRKPRQLSEQDVYRDAAQILEEVLENRLGRKSLKSNGSSITATGTSSSSGYYDASRESLDIWLKDDNSSYNFNIERSQTMPSSFKLEEKDEFTEEDIREYMKTKSDFANRRHSGSATSGESDALDNRVGAPLRRKKSFMRRAKERLSISFRRDREKENEEEKDQVRKKEKDRKKKKKNEKQSDMDSNGVEDDLNEVELRQGGNRNRSDSTASKRSSFFESFRRSFRSKRKSTSSISESQSADPVVGRRESGGSSTFGKRLDNAKHPSLPTIKDGGKKEEIVVPPIPKPYINTIDTIDLDDIKYIDEENTDQNKNKKGDLPKPIRSRTKPAPPPPSAPPLHQPDSLTLNSIINNNTTNDSESTEGEDHFDSPNFDKKDQSQEKKDKTEEDTEDKSEKIAEDNNDDIPFSEKSDSEKNDLFEKIAVKLMDMADHMEKSKTSSDTDGSLIKHYSTDLSSSVDPEHFSVDPEQLTALELEILECLRVGGDRLSQSFDDPVQVVVEQHRKQAYTRFYDTLRKGLGDEISWNQLSLIYQTATGAIKAAGAGTQLAFRVKDMTQQYIGDKFASWIVREGGWDSMLSESESEVTQ